MDEVYSSYISDLIGRTVASLEKRGFKAFYAKDAVEARERVLDMIAPGSTIGVGGSVTLRQIGLIEALESRGHTIYQRWGAQTTQAADLDSRRAQLACDVFLSSSNAVTVEGELVNVDGIGNRVASMIFGPGKVIVVAGWNKIVPDVNAAIQRIRNTAAPLNAKRLELKVPCAKTGYCTDCDVPENMCRVTTIISRKPRRTDLSVVLIAEQLGF
jgi:L-lactate utilization protein LutB